MNIGGEVCDKAADLSTCSGVKSLTHTNITEKSLVGQSSISIECPTEPFDMHADVAQGKKRIIGKNQPSSVVEAADEKPPAGKRPKLVDDLPSETVVCLVVEDIKENIIDDDVPMDLSKGVKKSAVTECAVSDSIYRNRISLDTSVVQRLRDELRNEETTLLLLRKLRHSQSSQQLSNGATTISNNRAQSSTGATPTAGHPTTSRTQTGARAGGAPVMNGTSTNHTGHRSVEQPRQSFTNSRPLPQSSVYQNGSSGRSTMPPVSASSRQTPGGGSQPASRQPVAASPSVIAHRPIVPHHHQPPSPRQTSVIRPPPRDATIVRPPVREATVVQRPPPREPPSIVRPPPVPELTLAQRQAAAKLAVRRQLEATLLQLPLPKCPPPELSFIPGIGSNVEFIALLGLEEAVQCIVNDKATTKPTDGSEIDGSSDCGDAKMTEDVLASGVVGGVTDTRKPFECTKCQSDFTTIWKRDKENSSTVVCERCATLASKHALKQEHTDRLKAAFLHALQQERELEATGYMSVAASVPSPMLAVGAASRSRPDVSGGSGLRNYDWRLHQSASDSRLAGLVQHGGTGLSSSPVLVGRSRIDASRPQQYSPVGTPPQFVRRN